MIPGKTGEDACWFVHDGKVHKTLKKFEMVFGNQYGERPEVKPHGHSND